MGLTAYRRVPLATLPTPLEFAPRLTEQLGGPQIYIKRDDLTGLAFGGNKTRKLEYLVADAQDQGATHLITAGGIQSNHVRQTAAAARIVGMTAEVVLNAPEEQPPVQGNYLLDRLLGANCHIIPDGADTTVKMEEIAADLRDQGKTPYVIPIGGSNSVGALGYVGAMLELNAQLWEQSVNANWLYHAAGSGGTQSGIVLGAALYGGEYQVVGVAVSGTSDQKVERAFELINQTADLLNVRNPVQRDHIMSDDSQVGPGYGIPTDETLAAIRLLAHTEGIFLDPVYTGKAFAALVADVRSGKLTSEDTVVFVHSGGAPSLFAKREEIDPIL